MFYSIERPRKQIPNFREHGIKALKVGSDHAGGSDHGCRTQFTHLKCLLKKKNIGIYFFLPPREKISLVLHYQFSFPRRYPAVFI